MKLLLYMIIMLTSCCHTRSYKLIEVTYFAGGIDVHVLGIFAYKSECEAAKYFSVIGEMEEAMRNKSDGLLLGNVSQTCIEIK